jgi:hypothetical protein
VREEFRGGSWAPFLYAHGVLFDVRRGLVGSKALLRYDTVPRLTACMFVFEHRDADDNKILFAAQRGDWLIVRWESLVDIRADEVFGSALKLTVEEEIRFRGVTVVLDANEKNPIEVAAQRIAKHLDISIFRAPHVSRPRAGGGIRVEFLPRPDRVLSEATPGASSMPPEDFHDPYGPSGTHCRFCSAELLGRSLDRCTVCGRYQDEEDEDEHEISSSGIAIITPERAAQTLLSALIAANHLALRNATDLHAVARGAAAIIVRHPTIETRAPALAEWLLAHASVEDLYIDDEALETWMKQHP